MTQGGDSQEQPRKRGGGAAQRLRGTLTATPGGVESNGGQVGGFADRDARGRETNGGRGVLTATPGAGRLMGGGRVCVSYAHWSTPHVGPHPGEDSRIKERTKLHENRKDTQHELWMRLGATRAGRRHRRSRPEGPEATQARGGGRGAGRPSLL